MMVTIRKETLKFAHKNGFLMLGEAHYGVKKMIHVASGRLLRKA